MKILITTSTFGKANSASMDLLKEKFEVISNPYGRKITTEEFIELTKDVDGVIAGVESITRDALSLRRNIRVISRCGVGIDNVDIDACNEYGIKLFNTPEAPVESVAELTVTIMLDLIKNVSNMNAAMKNNNWNKMTGLMMKDKKVGIIGLGRIGNKVGKLLEAFGAHIAYTDIENKGSLYPFMDKVELLKWADIISIHSSFCKEGEYIIDDAELKLMKGKYLVNTSRGRFVNETALIEALRDGVLAGAALDVFATEPYSGKLCSFENVILTPHIASSARESRVIMEIEAANNLIRGLGI